MFRDVADGPIACGKTMLELVFEAVFWVACEVLELVLGDLLVSIPLRVWVSLGLVGLGLVAVDRACAGVGPAHPALLFLAGIGLVLSPVALFMWPERPRPPRPRRR